MKKLLRFLWLAIQLKRQYKVGQYHLIGLLDEVLTYNSGYDFERHGITKFKTYIVAPYPMKGAVKFTRVEHQWRSRAEYIGNVKPSSPKCERIWFCKTGLITRFFHVPNALYAKEVSNG